jgi:hypothetical protein
MPGRFFWTSRRIRSCETASGDGGGLWMDGFSMDVTIRNSQITGNTSGDDGGGIYVEDTGGPLLIEDSVISGNTATSRGGGIYFYDPDDSLIINRATISGNNAGVAGGGIYLYDTDGDPVRISDSTLSGNTAGTGGGAYFYGPDDPVEIIGSTVSGNAAQVGQGGGLNFYNNYSVNLRHVTIVDNSASGVGGGVYAYESIAIEHSVVANNTSSDSADLATGDNSIDLRFSLVENTGTASINDNGGNQFSVDPLLGPLANNGGSTLTHLPLAGSPAIDSGDPTFVGPPTTDQTGNPRIVGGAVDLGALEVQAAVAQGPKVPVPALGLFGLAAAALGIGGAGAAAARRRKTGAPLAVVLLATAAFTSHAPEAAAAGRGPATTRIVTTISSVDSSNTRVSLALGNGQTVVADGATIEIKDSRRHVATQVRAANAIAAGQPALIKVRYGRDGAVKRTVVRLFDSIEAAQREVAGK